MVISDILLSSCFESDGPKLKTLVKRRRSYKVCINTWRDTSHKSLIGNNLPGTLPRSPCGNKTQSQTTETSKTSESTARLSLAERRSAITEIRGESNELFVK